MGMKTIDPNIQYFVLLEPYSTIFVDIVECSKTKDYMGYINLVETLKNMSILSFSDYEINVIREMNRIKREYIEDIETTYENEINGERIKNSMNNSQTRTNKESMIRTIEYRISQLIYRICIIGLRRTILREMIPNAQGISIHHSIKCDVNDTIEEIKHIFSIQGMKYPKIKYVDPEHTEDGPEGTA